MSVAHHAEACIIGAGVIGLATARALAMAGKEVLILEREPTIGSGISSRNSEVIHAGIYYPPGSRKAKHCVAGRNMLYEYCVQRHIPHDVKGKLIVATSDAQLKNDVPQILRQARENGVDDLIQLSEEDVHSNFESEVTCRGAIFSPSTGVVDSHSFMLSLLADAEECGATLALNSTVVGASVADSEFNVDGKGGIIIEAEGMQLCCDIVVNCAGLHSDHISSLLLGSIPTSQDISGSGHNTGRGDKMQRHYYAKGNYYRLEGQKSPFQHLVYPMPEKGGLGVHATIDLGGNTRFGPDVEWKGIDISDPDTIDLGVDPKRADLFYDEVRKYWPGLRDGALQPDYAGIRPKIGHPLQPDGQSIKADFVIDGSNVHGVKGLVNMLGIESPGLTASMSIADTVVKILSKDGVL